MKKLTALFLALIMMLCMIPAVSAAPDEATEAAQTLYELGLFKGTGTNPDGTPIFALEKIPTRNQAVIMLVRLLGKEEEALAGNWELPFTDVPKGSTAYPYIGYAYANGLTNGTSATTYSGGNPIRANQYITFVLRALGYVSGEDFKVSTAWEFSDRIGLTDGRYDSSTTEFLRSDIALISESALSTSLKGSNVMLLRKLYNQKSAANYAAAAKTLQVSKLGLPAAIGKTTLTYNDAYALLGKDPAVIADAVKTVGDVIQYMNAANFGNYTPGTFTPWYRSGGEAWGFDPPGEEQLRQNYATCCAGYVNMALYLLKDDYEEQGVIRWMGGGNHTISYVKANGKYYAFDLTFGDFRGPITELDRLEDYYDRIPGNYPKAEMTNLVAFQDTDVCYPWGWHRETNTLIFPSETREHVVQIYPKNSSAAVSFEDAHIEIPMWNTDKLDIPASYTMYDTYEALKEKYISADITLLFSNGFLVQEDSSFGTGRGHQQITVQADGRAITNYTAKSSDPSICTVCVEANGVLTFMPKQSGSCMLYITYRGQTAKFYYQTAF